MGLLHIRRRDAIATVIVHVKKAPRCCGPGPATRAGRALGRDPAAPAMTNPPASVPDLVPLPSWGVRIAHLRKQKLDPRGTRRSRGTSCPPPTGSGAGQGGWHTPHDPRYKTARPDQILECLTATRDRGLFLYLWTLPSQRVILLAGDSSHGASYSVLQNWWAKVTYG